MLLIRGAMGARSNGRRWSALALVAAIAPWLGGCDLNPQPLPPGYTAGNASDSGPPMSSGGAGSGATGSSGGSSSGGAFTASDASEAAPAMSESDAGSADVQIDGGFPDGAAPASDAGDAGDAADVGTSAPGDASLDALSD
jgi:hypothetical protein